MKIEKVTQPKSAFLSARKDFGLLVDLFLKNDRLKKLLFYTSKDCMKKPNLTEDQSLELFGKNIRIVPKLFIDGEVLNYIVVNFDEFVPNETNPEFRDNVIEFDIICHFDQWQLDDMELRPYRIAAEIDSMLDGKHLTGIGETEFLLGKQIVLTNELAGLCLMYRVVHGEEDKKKMPNPANQEEFENFYNDLFNNGKHPIF